MTTYLRGALVEFMAGFLVPQPNVITFQFNPESMTHEWTQPEPVGPTAEAPQGDPMAVRGLPGESFNFTVAMDAGDDIADGGPVGRALAQASGVYARIAALEMLLYPVANTGGGLLGTVSAAQSAIAAAKAGVSRQVPGGRAPTVLFVWGPGRIVPVRVVSLVITETLYDEALNPTHAEAQLGLRVLTPDELASDKDLLAPVARAAYLYSQGLRQTLALANLARGAASVIGMLPV